MQQGRGHKAILEWPGVCIGIVEDPLHAHVKPGVFGGDGDQDQDRSWSELVSHDRADSARLARLRRNKGLARGIGHQQGFAAADIPMFENAELHVWGQHGCEPPPILYLHIEEDWIT